MQAAGQEQPAEALGLFNFEEDNLTPTQIPGATSHPTKSLAQINKKQSFPFLMSFPTDKEYCYRMTPFQTQHAADS